MSISTKFQSFCSNIRISDNNTNKISSRYKAITKRLNTDFWDTESDTNHSLYVWSYWRDTDIHVSDIDVLMRLPWSIQEKYDKYISNWQSSLLNAVKESLQKTYNTSHIKWDWQVIQINFDDWICFEIVPGFLYDDWKYCYPDTNNGWSWKTTDPQSEIKEIREKDIKWNWNLKRLCRMIRSWKDHCSVNLGWLLIDTFAYNFLKDWEYKDQSFSYYDWMTRDFFDFLSKQDEDQDYRLAPGSNQRVNRKWSFNYKAKQAYLRSLEAMQHEDNNNEYSANLKWKEIYGSKF